MSYYSILLCVCIIHIQCVIFHTRHILPPSEIDLGLFWAVLQAQKGNTYFTELAERVEYGSYVFRTCPSRLWPKTF